MQTQEFWNFILTCKSTSSTTERRQIVRDMINDTDPWKPLVTLLAGQKMDNAGVNTKTLKKGVTQSSLQISNDQISNAYTNEGSITEALMTWYSIGDTSEKQINDTVQLTSFSETDKQTSTYGEQSIESLYQDILDIHTYSGNDLQSYLGELFSTYYPPLVAFCANPSDFSIKVKSKTICRAIAEEDYSDLSTILRLYGLEPNAVQFVDNFFTNDMQTEPIPGKIFKPMAARQQKDSTSLDDLSEDHIAEVKFDGNRIILHSTGGSNPEILAHTRRFNDYTDKLVELQEINWPEESMILDTEIIATDPDTGETLPVTKTGAIRRKEGTKDVDYDMTFKVFDIISYDGKDYSTHSFTERREQLEEVLSSVESQHIELVEVYTDLHEARNFAVQEELEGLILKDCNQPYVFKRSRAWKKNKLRMVTADLVLASFEEGSGHKSGSLGRAALETQDGEFVGYVGTGFDDELSQDIWDNQEEYEGKIVEIQFDGLDDALRTPSFIRFRPEGEADTYDRLKHEIAPAQ